MAILGLGGSVQPEPYVDPNIDWAQKNLKTNSSAESQRMGGTFTPAGLEENSQLIIANGSDMEQLQQMENLPNAVREQRVRQELMQGLGGSPAPLAGY